MTRYDELVNAAEPALLAFYEGRRVCDIAARRLYHELATYLEAPEGSVTFVKLSNDLQPTDPCDEPSMVFMNRVWNFCVQITLKKPNSSVQLRTLLSFTVRPESDSVAIAHDGSEYVLAPQGPDFEPLLSHVYRGMVEQRERPFEGPSRRIGF